MPRAPRRCTGPGCDRPPVAKGLCSGHYSQSLRHRELTPLRTGPARVVLSLRVSPPAKARAAADPDGARSALETWARR